MKNTFLILALLCSGTMRLEEACKRSLKRNTLNRPLTGGWSDDIDQPTPPVSPTDIESQLPLSPINTKHNALQVLESPRGSSSQTSRFKMTHQHQDLYYDLQLEDITQETQPQLHQKPLIGNGKYDLSKNEKDSKPDESTGHSNDNGEPMPSQSQTDPELLNPITAIIDTAKYDTDKPKPPTVKPESSRGPHITRIKSQHQHHDSGYSSELQEIIKEALEPPPLKQPKKPIVGNGNDDLSKNKKDSKADGQQEFDHHLLIAGEGAQAVAVTVQLNESGIKPPFRLMTVDMKSVSGPGLPYDEDVVNPEHLLNVFSASLVAISGKQADFFQWLHGLTDQNLRSEYTKAWTNFIINGEMPNRRMIGRYLTDQLQIYFKNCRAKDYKTDTMNHNTEAVNIRAHETGNGYLVKLSTQFGSRTKHREVYVRDVFLATGHWYRGRFKNPPKGYYESPWPAYRLIHEIKPVHIGILAAGLNGIDAVMTVAHNFGDFDKTFLNYKIKREEFKGFEITVYSRTGFLPRVRPAMQFGHTPDYTPKHVSTENISLTMENDGLPAFDAIFKLLKLDLAEILPSIKNLGSTIDTIKPAQLFPLVDQVLNPVTDPEEAFLLDLKGEGSPLRYRRSIHELFKSAENSFRSMREKCKAEDVIRFKDYISPRLVRVATDFPMTNAKKLRTLMEKGRLHLRAMGENYKIGNKTDGQGVTIKYWRREPDQPEEVEVEVHHDYFIEAMGQSGHIAKDPRQLTQSLLENKLATPIRFLYDDQEYAEKVYNDDASDDKNRYRIVKIDGKYYYESDGVVMDKDTSRVIPADGVTNTGNIYASGPFLYGDILPVSYGLQIGVKTAQKAVKHMETVLAAPVDGVA